MDARRTSEDKNVVDDVDEMDDMEAVDITEAKAMAAMATMPYHRKFKLTLDFFLVNFGICD